MAQLGDAHQALEAFAAQARHHHQAQQQQQQQQQELDQLDQVALPDQPHPLDPQQAYHGHGLDLDLHPVLDSALHHTILQPDEPSAEISIVAPDAGQHAELETEDDAFRRIASEEVAKSALLSVENKTKYSTYPRRHVTAASSRFSFKH